MKNTGIVRRLDELGRIVIPIEIRNQFNITERDSLEIYVENDKIILQKPKESCIICGNTENLRKLKNKWICEECRKTLKKL